MRKAANPAEPRAETHLWQPAPSTDGTYLTWTLELALDVLFRLPEVNFVDDGIGKPVGINEHVGRRPIAAFGNSDGDLEMLQWTTKAGKPGLGLIVHHTDAEREYAYDRKSEFGRLDKVLDVAELNRWTVLDMKKDWKRIFAFE